MKEKERESALCAITLVLVLLPLLSYTSHPKAVDGRIVLWASPEIGPIADSTADERNLFICCR